MDNSEITWPFIPGHPGAINNEDCFPFRVGGEGESSCLLYAGFITREAPLFRNI